MGHDHMGRSFTLNGYRQIHPRPSSPVAMTHNLSLPPLSSPRPVHQMVQDASTLGRHLGNGNVFDSFSVPQGHQNLQGFQKPYFEQHGLPSSHISSKEEIRRADDTRNNPEIENWLDSLSSSYPFYPSTQPSSGIPVPNARSLPDKAMRRHLPPPEPQEPDPFRYGHSDGHLAGIPKPYTPPLPPISLGNHYYNHATSDRSTATEGLPPIRSVVPGILENEIGDGNRTRMGQQQQAKTSWPHHRPHQHHRPHPHHHQHHSHPLNQCHEHSPCENQRSHHRHLTHVQSQIQDHHYHGQNHGFYNHQDENDYDASQIQWRNRDSKMMEGYTAPAGSEPNPHSQCVRGQNTRITPTPAADLFPSTTSSASPFFSNQANSAQYSEFLLVEREREREYPNEEERKRRPKIEMDGPKVEFKRVEWEKSRIERESVSFTELLEDGTDGSDEGKVSPRTVPKLPWY